MAGARRCRVVTQGICWFLAAERQWDVTGGRSGLALPMDLQFSGVSKEWQVEETAKQANTAGRS